MKSSTNNERRRTSGYTVQLLPVIRTVTLLGPENDLLPPRIRPLQSAEVTNLSKCDESRQRDVFYYKVMFERIVP